ncbi:MAG: gliding motility-associated C-terminal domain-containing protein [Saprospiraceae bacterium]|nr:gliding motility-associated C-terminal domain-containing protein [Candidatus Vicinibacter affinis]
MKNLILSINPFDNLKIKIFACYLIITILHPNITISQANSETYCGFEKVYRKWSNSDTKTEEIILQNERKYLNYIENLSIKERRLDYQIPLVVHIIAPPGSPVGTGSNLTDFEILKGLQLLNDALANKNHFYSAEGIDTKISLCLARRDSNQKPISGIFRIESDLVNSFDCNHPSTDINSDQDLKALSFLDCDQYLNIWLVTDLFENGLGCSLAGYAYFPGAFCGLDGIVVESRYWNTESGVRITAHEIGHYLGLHHTFFGGCKNINCFTDGDYVCDTPPDNSAPFSSCNINSCNTEVPDVVDNNDNYMDYSNCFPFKFSVGQLSRMIFHLEETRPKLFKNINCQGVIPLDANIIALMVPDSVCGIQVCPKFTVLNVGTDYIQTLKVEFVLNGNSQFVDYNLNLPPNELIELNIPCENIILSTADIKIEISKINNEIPNFTNLKSITKEIKLYTIPEINIISIDSCTCGKNGIVTFGNKLSEQNIKGRLEGQFQWQSSLIFSNLKTGLTKFEFINQFGCISSLTINVPDKCPPCISGIINKYSPVFDICNKNVVSVEDPKLFDIGNKVLIIQMQGAQIDETNTIDFGNIQNIRNSGNYEINEIGNINGNKIGLKYELDFNYDITGTVQLIYIPVFDSVSVCNLSCLPFDGRKGGVLIFLANHTQVEGNIDVSGLGFRGGQVEHAPDIVQNFRSFFSSNSLDGGKKGEGIANYILGKQYGRGKQGNAGGGGNNHNTGGGGGALGGDGGQGGYFDFYPIAQASHGLGGLKIDYPCSFGKLFMGAGGGAGHSNLQCSAGSSGGNGGGIVIIKTNSLNFQASNLNLNSNGSSSLDSDVTKGNNRDKGCDATGGGGAGGTILIDATNVTGFIFNTNTNGGKAGDVYWVTTGVNGHGIGQGGGGSGGYIYYANNPISTSNPSMMGGNHGWFYGSTQTPINYGATNGQNGAYKTHCEISFSSKLPTPISLKLIAGNTFCDSNLIPYKIEISGGVKNYSIEINSIPIKISDSIYLTNNSTNLIRITDFCGSILDTLIIATNFSPLSDSLIFLQHPGCNNVGSIIINGIGGLPDYIYRINSGNWQNDGHFNNLSSGTYEIAIRDNRGCEITKTYDLVFKNIPLIAKIDSYDLELSCLDSFSFISISVNLNSSINNYTLNDSLRQNHGRFDNIKVGKNTIKITSPLSCDSILFEVLVVSKNLDITTFDSTTFCLGDTLIFNGQLITNATIIRDTFKNLQHCDSIVVFKVQTINPSVSSLNQKICKGDTIEINAIQYFKEGSYTTIETNHMGCDSILTISIAYLRQDTILQSSRICFGDTLFINGKEYFSSGVYQIKSKNILGCDSLTILNLSVGNFILNDVNHSICKGDSVLISNNFYYNEGIVNDTIIRKNQCDSIVTHHINFNPLPILNKAFSICKGDSVKIGNKFYNNAGLYKDTLNQAGSCDSVYISNISILSNSLDSINSQICDGESINFNGISYTQQGFYFQNFLNQYGCDSSIVFYLKVNNTSSGFLDTTLCEDEYIKIGNNTIKMPGDFQSTFKNHAGCDSLLSVSIKYKICHKIIAPNVFSPNGDAINDKFEIFYEGIRTIKTEIYTRWGELIFCTNEANNFWDGKFNGIPCNSGTYVYFISGIFTNGKPFKISGDRTLIR